MAEFMAAMKNNAPLDIEKNKMPTPIHTKFGLLRKYSNLEAKQCKIISNVGISKIATIR